MSRRSFSPTRGGGILRARHLTTLGLALGLAVGATAFAAPAGATPQSDLASKTAQAQHLAAEIDANSNRADVLDEQYLQAQNAVAAANHAIVAAEAGISSARSQESTLRSRLGGRAALLYMGAGSGDPIGIDATSVQELGSRAKYGAAAAETDDRMIGQLTVLDEQLQVQTRDLQKQKAAAQDQQDAADKARHDVEQANNTLQNLLSSTKSDIKDLANKIEAQKEQAAAAAEKARIQAQEAQAAAAARAADTSSASSSNNSSGHSRSALGIADTGVAPADLPAPSGGASAAIAYARAQLGKPYVYAGDGPGSFDCSGLTMMAWAQGGVGMSHGSQSQWASFPKVPISQLQPGDLVFFGSSGPSNHHVGLYIGGGTMIEAPHTGAFVRYSSIFRPDLVSTGSRP
jgi:cell wall-associated NlpC family hydrolase